MNRSPTIIIIIFIISLLLAVFLVAPKYQELKEKRGLVLQKEIELRNQKQYKTEIDSLSEELKKYSNEVEKIESALPLRFSLLSLLNYLQKTSSENGLILKNYSVSTQLSKETQRMEPEKTETQKIKEYKLSLNLTGFYSSFKNFISVLEKSSRLIEVEDISFSLPEKDKPSDFNIGIKVYSY